jgi:hypothetical protein
VEHLGATSHDTIVKETIYKKFILLNFFKDKDKKPTRGEFNTIWAHGVKH